MKFRKLLSDAVINVNISKYRIDWDKKVSGPQKKTKDFLRPYWETDVVLEEFMIPGSRLRIDLFNITQKIAIEVSPDSTHKNFNKFMHRTRGGYLETFKKDLKKQEWIENSGYKYIALTDIELKQLNKKFIEEEFNIIL